MSRRHTYDCVVTWTGNRGTGTSSYRGYDRAHDVAGAALPTIPGSADPAFRGDPARWNPEQLLVAALSQFAPNSRKSPIAASFRSTGTCGCKRTQLRVLLNMKSSLCCA